MNQKPTVLIIDDDHDTRVVLRETLENIGFSIESATNGKVGLELLRKTKPQVIVLDLQMPVMDGWEFLNLLRKDEEFSAIPVLVTSTPAEHLEIPEVEGFLPKPIRIATAVEEIKKHLSDSVKKT